MTVDWPDAWPDLATWCGVTVCRAPAGTGRRADGSVVAPLGLLRIALLGRRALLRHVTAMIRILTLALVDKVAVQSSRGGVKVTAVLCLNGPQQVGVVAMQPRAAG